MTKWSKWQKKWVSSTSGAQKRKTYLPGSSVSASIGWFLSLSGNPTPALSAANVGTPPEVAVNNNKETINFNIHLQ